MKEPNSISAIGETDADHRGMKTDDFERSRGSIEFRGRNILEKSFFNILVRFSSFYKECITLFDTGSPICSIKSSVVPSNSKIF